MSKSADRFFTLGDPSNKWMRKPGTEDMIRTSYSDLGLKSQSISLLLVNSAMRSIKLEVDVSLLIPK